MFVSERDIFDYIYYPEHLDPKLVSYIKKNVSLLKNELDHYNQTRNSSVEPAPFENEILKELIGDNGFFIIKLKKIESKHKRGISTISNNSNQQNINQNILTETFVDEDSQYLVKVVRVNEHTSINVFNKNNSLLKNFILTLYPQGNSFNCKDNQSPLIINDKRTIDEVKLEIS